MGACNSSTPRRVHKSSNVSAGPDDLSVRQKVFQKEIQMNPFYSFNTTVTQQNYVSQFITVKQLPTTFIQSNTKYSDYFKKQYSTTYLKSDPFLNNIYSDNDDKSSQLLFFNLSLFLLSNGGAFDRKIDLANTFLVESYDVRQKKYNISTLKNILNNIINITLFFIIYFGGATLFMNEETKNRIFSNEEFFMIDDFYDICKLDDFFFEQFLTINREVTKDSIITLWENFLLTPVNEMIAPDTDKTKERNYDNLQLTLSDNSKEEIKFRLCHMLDSSVFFESLLKNKISDYNNTKFKQNS